jgi:tetratricopeptide (TPR) repeat protein
MKLQQTGDMKKLAGVLLVIGCLASIYGCRTSKQGYVTKGNKLFDAGKYADAAINYSKAIQKDRAFGEAYYRLGLAEIKEQKPREAIDALYRAFDLLPTDFPVKEQLGSLALEYYLLDPQRPQSYYKLVKQTSDSLVKNNPKSFEGLREQAYLAMTDGKRDESTILFRKAIEVNPSDATVTTALIQNLIVTGHGMEAEKLALDLVARQKSYGEVYNVLYGWYLKNNRPADAENILKAKVANNPKQGGYVLELAAHYARLQKSAEMRAALQRMLDDPKDFPQARLWVGDFYVSLRNYPEAVRYFEEGARTAKDPEKVRYEKGASAALLAEGNGAQASSTIDQIVKEHPQDEEARRAQADLLLRSGNLSKIEAAEREFQELSKEKPNDASIWLKLGQAQELRGNPDAARAYYLQASNKNPNYLQARYALAEIDLAVRRPDETLQQASEILKIRPDDSRARLLHAQALARTGNAASARSELTRIKDFQHNPQAQVELGLLALSEKKYQEAEQVFKKIVETGNQQAIAGLATTYASQKQFDQALAVLNAGLRKSNNSALLLSQLGNTEAVAGNYDAAIAAVQKLIALQPNSVRDRLLLADILTLQGDNNRALAANREAAQLAPSDLTAGLEFARALGRAGRVDEARSQYQAVLKAHPDDDMALNDMAFFICEHGGNLDQALGFAQRALQRVPEQPSFSDTVGCIYLKKGLKDSAVQVFGNLVRKYPKYPAFRYHLGMALLENGDKTSAKKELETALAAHPSRRDEMRIRELLGKIS